MGRKWAWGVVVPAVAVAGYGLLMWHNNAPGVSFCNSFLGQLSQSSSIGVLNNCHEAALRVDLGIACTVVGLAAIIFGAIALATAPRRPHDPPYGWMRVPFGWQPSTQPFMPVPPGWLPPAPEWMPPVGWLPPANWPLPPAGWPQPPRPA